MESAGGQSRALTDGLFSSTAPSWSRDGTGIYFGSDRTGRFEIWRVPLEGGAAAQVTRDGGYISAESMDARKLYYTKTGTTGPLFELPLAGGKESQVLERVAVRGLSVFDDGIYYLDFAAPGWRKAEIRFHDFATDRSRVINPIDGQLGLGGLTVSQDRKTFLFTLQSVSGSDLMMIENFR